MVKRQKTKNGKKASRGGRRTRLRGAIAGRLDAAAAAYAQLLVDPCNARLVAPTYAGMGTGELRRFRKILKIPATAVEGTYYFTPGANSFNFATHVVANAGTPYAFTNPAKLFDLQNDTQSRCLAACVKVRYINAEQNRAGAIGLRTAPYQYYMLGHTSDVNTDMSLCTQVNRTAEVVHEVKFVPGADDQTFTHSVEVASTPPGYVYSHLGTLGFTFVNCPAGSLQFEITAVLEIESQGDIVPASVPPASNNSLNQVLGFLGSTAQWAFGRVAAPVLKSAYNGVMQSVTHTGAASAGMAMLTL